MIPLSTTAPALNNSKTQTVQSAQRSNRKPLLVVSTPCIDLKFYPKDQDEETTMASQGTSYMIAVNSRTQRQSRKEHFDCPYRLPGQNGYCPYGHYHTSYTWEGVSSIDGNFCVVLPDGNTHVRMTIKDIRKSFNNRSVFQLSNQALWAQLSFYNQWPGDTRAVMLQQLYWLARNSEGLAHVRTVHLALELGFRRQRILDMVRSGIPAYVVLSTELDSMEWQELLDGETELKGPVDMSAEMLKSTLDDFFPEDFVHWDDMRWTVPISQTQTTP